ncbi:MAG: hypothetical protein M0D55_17390 [Elusimicrobiota bacterium]|nr:MAG: hypothetical protein M0D55_17390 [Elusimicrobiota bacterium]
MSVIANSARFNKLSLTWQAASLGLRDVEFRGVNDVPWELSEFVLYKRGGLGPEPVVGEFRGAEAAIEERDGWFSRAFVERRSWPLPDGTTAVLYARRRQAAPPLRGRSFSGPLRVSSLLEIPAAELALGPWNAKRGVYERVSAAAPLVRLKGLAVAGVRAELRDAVLVADAGGARLVSVGGVSIRAASVDAAALSAFLTRGPLRARSVALDGTARVAVSAKGLPFSAEAALVSGPGRPCAAELRAVRAAGVPIAPGAFLRWGANGPLFELSTSPGRTTVRTVFGLSRSVPFEIELPGCSARGGRLSIP